MLITIAVLLIAGLVLFGIAALTNNKTWRLFSAILLAAAFLLMLIFILLNRG